MTLYQRIRVNNLNSEEGNARQKMASNVIDRIPMPSRPWLCWSRGLLCTAILFAGLFLVRVRYITSRNFEPIHVQINGEALKECRIFYQSIYASWGKLAVDERYPNRWIQSPSVNGVTRILVAYSGEQPISLEEIEVRVGDNWSLAQIIPVRPGVLPSTPPVDEGRSLTSIEFLSPVESWAPVARGTINWQGDLWLVLVPALQILTLCGILMFLWRLIEGTENEKRSIDVDHLSRVQS